MNSRLSLPKFENIVFLNEKEELKEVEILAEDFQSKGLEEAIINKLVLKIRYI